MDRSRPLQGGCHCGAVRLEVGSPLPAPINCHCGLCRRLSGAAFTTWVSVPLEVLGLSGEAQLSVYQATPHLQRCFCQRCGGHVLTRDARWPGIAGLPAGVLDDAAVPEPRGEYFVSHKAPWHALPAAADCFGGDTGFEPLQRPADADGA